MGKEKENFLKFLEKTQGDEFDRGKAEQALDGLSKNASTATAALKNLVQRDKKSPAATTKDLCCPILSGTRNGHRKKK